MTDTNDLSKRDDVLDRERTNELETKNDQGTGCETVGDTETNFLVDYEQVPVSKTAFTVLIKDTNGTRH